METSQELQQLAEALAKAQAELSPVPFDSNRSEERRVGKECRL